MNWAADNFTINTKGFFKEAVSPDRLKKAWCQLKSNQIFFNLDFSWFEKNSQMLINSTFEYPMARKINVAMLKSNSSGGVLNIVNSKVNIIEKALLNSFEIIFEGAYAWSVILKSEFKNAEANLKTTIFKGKYQAVNNLKTAKIMYKKKVQVSKRVFKSTSFGYRTGKSAHQALYFVKTRWHKDTVYFLNYNMMQLFENIHMKRLKNTFNRYVQDSRFWEEIEKMFDAGCFFNLNPQRVSQSSLLSPFLFNLYMHDFDQFIENLNDECQNIMIWYNNKNYHDIILKKFRSRCLYKSSNNILKVYYELFKHNKKCCRTWSNCVTSKGRPFEDSWKFCRLR
jgi:hypothetical protein